MFTRREKGVYSIDSLERLLKLLEMVWPFDRRDKVGAQRRSLLFSFAFLIPGSRCARWGSLPLPSVLQSFGAADIVFIDGF
jgi:hypothetical protein